MIINPLGSPCSIESNLQIRLTGESERKYPTVTRKVYHHSSEYSTSSTNHKRDQGALSHVHLLEDFQRLGVEHHFVRSNLEQILAGLSSFELR
jgi:hypothetical protein